LNEGYGQVVSHKSSSDYVNPVMDVQKYDQDVIQALGLVDEPHAWSTYVRDYAQKQVDQGYDRLTAVFGGDRNAAIAFVRKLDHETPLMNLFQEESLHGMVGTRTAVSDEGMKSLHPSVDDRKR